MRPAVRCKPVVSAALKALREGSPVLVFDSAGREEEVDMIFYAGFIDSDKVYMLRAVAGGLVCFATSGDVAKSLGLPYGYELYSAHPALAQLARRTLGYGDKPAFTVWVNHISVRTGISDSDRALTIKRLHDVVKLASSGMVNEAREVFFREFVGPGHVPILAAKPLDARRGHTELSVALAELASLPPSIALAEMLGKGVSLTLAEARRLSQSRGWPLVSGDEIVECYEKVVEEGYGREGRGG